MSISRPRVVVLGLGPIGKAVATEILKDASMELVGAVDPAPSLVGRDLRDVLGANGAPRVTVAPEIGAIGARADVAVHMAGSRFLRILPQLQDLVRRKLHVVSTCEELVAASVRWPDEAGALDREAQEANVAVLATGVNPGFVMDLLPSAISNACVSVRAVRVTRRVDTAKRRRALQEKTGAGLTRAEFAKRVREGTVGHVGLRDSLLFLLDHLPIDASAGEESIRPILATRAVGKGAARVAKGRVAGVRQRVLARNPATKRVVATYDLEMAIGLAKPYDEILIDGDPPIRLRIEGGIQGDRATVGMVLSSIRAAPDARPGLAR